MKLYKTIVADPPWTPKQGSTWKTRFTDKARPQKHYVTMTLDELKGIEIPAEKQCHLYLWVINQHIDWGYELARHWGFEPIQVLTWCKGGLGTGRFQCNTEHVLVCRRGTRHGNPFGMSGGTYFNWPRGEHSEKPHAFYELVEKISPPPYFEMFARKRRVGWDAMGDELENTTQERLEIAPTSDASPPSPITKGSSVAKGGVTKHFFCANCGVFKGHIWVSKGLYKCSECGYPKEHDPGRKPPNRKGGVVGEVESRAKAGAYGRRD